MVKDFAAIIKILPKNNKILYIVLIFCNFFIIISSVSQQYFEKKIFIAVTNEGYNSIKIILFLFFLVYVLITVFSFFKSIITAKLIQKNAEHLKEQVFYNALLLPVSEQNKKDDALSVIAFDAEELAKFLPVSLFEFLFSLVTFIAYASFCFYLSPVLAITALILIIPSVLIEKIFIPKIKVQARKVSRQESHIRTFLKETIYSIDIIKIFSMNKNIFDNLGELDLARSKNKIKKMHLDSLLFTSGNMLSYFAIFGIFMTGAYLYVKKQIEMSDLIVSLIAIESGLVWPASNFLNQFSDLADKIIHFERVNQFINIKNDKTEKLNKEYKIEKNEETEILFDNVSFTYSKKDLANILEEDKIKKILDNINLKIEHNSHICITGESGTGKSTLVNLLLNFIKPQKGCIKFNYKTKDYNDDIRKLISFVPQTGAIFMDSVYENICMSKPDANEDEVIEAAKKAGAHSFIMQMPDKYNTFIGGKEDKLSGGQVQRISIARAILKNSPILVMDEPSSALDSETEKIIIDLIKDYKGTVIYISHRQELIQAADIIYELNNGKLIKKDKLYYKRMDENETK